MRSLFSLLAAVVLAAAALPCPVRAAEYKVDPVHSSFIFKIKHFNTSFFYGRFNEASGTLNYDESKPEAATIELSIKSASVDTNNKDRDKHVTSPDFFNAKEFPTITFKSTKVTVTGTALEITGDLTALGVTKPVTLKGELTGKGKNMKGVEIIGGEGTVTFKRSEFGIKGTPAALADDVTLIISIEALKQ
ncbi:MAG: YceI family protein [Candidatus Methylacidiphilales bacterium]|nr:YceI family protein [Candidatus Methylacidiphilales bacterium]